MEGGWRSAEFPSAWGETPLLGVQKGVALFLNPRSKRQVSLPFEKIALDPLFWQALGTALGWEDGKEFTYTRTSGSPNWKIVTSTRKPNLRKKAWQHHAKRFCVLILINGDTEQFWKEVLTEK